MALLQRIGLGPAVIGAVAIALPVATAFVTSASSASDAAARVAVLPLAAAQTALPYAPLPSSADLAALTAALRRSVRATHIALVPGQRVDDGVRAAGFDQANGPRACITAACAAHVGHAVGATIVVIGTVTRAIGVHWATNVQVVAVPSGQQLGEYAARVVGDEASMQADEGGVAGCIARIVRAEHPPCRDTGDFGV